MVSPNHPRLTVDDELMISKWRTATVTMTHLLCSSSQLMIQATGYFQEFPWCRIWGAVAVYFFRVLDYAVAKKAKEMLLHKSSSTGCTVCVALLARYVLHRFQLIYGWVSCCTKWLGNGVEVAVVLLELPTRHNGSHEWPGSSGWLWYITWLFKIWKLGRMQQDQSSTQYSRNSSRISQLSMTPSWRRFSGCSWQWPKWHRRHWELKWKKWWQYDWPTWLKYRLEWSRMWIIWSLNIHTL